MKKSNQKTYNCFSPKQFQFLVAKGNFPIAQYRHHKTKKVFWVFIITDQLSETLTEWSSAA